MCPTMSPWHFQTQPAQSYKDKAELASAANGVIAIPDVHPMLMPLLGVAPLQLFAYYVALMRGCDIDKPRNLAKSVTVE